MPDFVGFLSIRVVRGDKPSAKGEWTSGEFAGFSLSQAMRGMEDDPVTYTPADLSGAELRPVLLLRKASGRFDDWLGLCFINQCVVCIDYSVLRYFS